eukprot:TRINITY_DN37703_c0_g1_i1.p1 TRINITY_DN37703_c0_g1~~TRINITY_DN37703_c0_g1_i1.p1  ORF type:complete len:176 (-),score=26.03 TRINITY_DN37703_c0_g1_i1:132-659(-)
MEVVSEIDAMYMPHYGRKINAMMRDVGFTAVQCGLCGEMATRGFLVSLPRCRHNFHYNCFRQYFQPQLRSCSLDSTEPPASEVGTPTSFGAPTPKRGPSPLQDLLFSAAAADVEMDVHTNAVASDCKLSGFSGHQSSGSDSQQLRALMCPCCSSPLHYGVTFPSPLSPKRAKLDQ